MTVDVREIVNMADLPRRVERRLANFLDAEVASTPVRSLSEAALLRPLREMVLRGGKRLRAAFCYWGWRGAGGADAESAVAAGAALEMLHAAALVHDDVMDASALRRGQPTLHRRLAEHHLENAWRGDSAHFGVSAAIVAGDLCLVWADKMLRASGLSVESLARAGPVFDAMRAETMRGQYLDLAAQSAGAFDADDALRVARAKTAACTVEGPLRFGGVLAGATSPLVDRYVSYGRSLGVAFQLQDDLLGAYGDARVTGKPSGDDLRDGKCTLLLAEARRMADPETASRLDALLREGTDAAVPRLRALIEETGARARVERLVDRLGADAVKALDSAPFADEQARDVLRALALALTTAAA